MNGLKFCIIGTAKSQDKSQYYISERWKMWGILYFTRKIETYWKNMDDFEKNANQEFAIKNQFSFFDLIDGTYSVDSKIDFSDENIKKNIQKNTEKIINTDVKNLIFNGKKAYQTFLFGCTLLDENLTHLLKLKKVIKESHYGKQILQIDSKILNERLSKKNIYLAPNTSSTAKSFNEFQWIEILKAIN